MAKRDATLRDERAAWDLVLANEGLVLWNISRFLRSSNGSHGNFQFDDFKTAAFMAAFRAALTWDPSKAKLSTYLSSCVYNGLREEVRRLQVGERSRTGVFYAGSFIPSELEKIAGYEEFEDQLLDSIRADESQDSLRTALETLSDDQRELIRLRYFEGWDWTRIGEHFGITKQGAERRHTTIKKRLRKALEEGNYARSE